VSSFPPFDLDDRLDAIVAAAGGDGFLILSSDASGVLTTRRVTSQGVVGQPASLTMMPAGYFGSMTSTPGGVVVLWGEAGPNGNGGPLHATLLGSDATATHDAVLTRESSFSTLAPAWVQGHLVVTFAAGLPEVVEVRDLGWFGEAPWSVQLPSSMSTDFDQGKLGPLFESSGQLLFDDQNVMYGAMPGKPFEPVWKLAGVSQAAAADGCGRAVSLSTTLAADGGAPETGGPWLVQAWQPSSSVNMGTAAPYVWMQSPRLLPMASGFGVLWNEWTVADKTISNTLRFGTLAWE
jgi:hypothetical protein